METTTTPTLAITPDRAGDIRQQATTLLWVALRDGTMMPCRPIRAADAAALQRFHRNLSESSVRFRFFHAMPTLSDAMARGFTDIDGHDQYAIVALDPANPDEIIAVVRYIRDEGTANAEYAAVVADAWQGRGIGMALTQHLVEAARERGIDTFTAHILPDNTKMLHLLRDIGLPEHIRRKPDEVIVRLAIG